MLKYEDQEDNGLIMKNYQILQKIGQGGNGEVYLVRYKVTDQIRVAKRYQTNCREGCLRELRTMRNLHHPALPGILDVVHMGDTEWLVMEYIPGKCLNELPRQLFSMEQFWSIAEQLAEVLVYLHNRTSPILHLDIKPANLIWTNGGKLVLLDFGAAVMKTQNEETNPCMGTPGFAAPEQSLQNIVLDDRADIYGFGAVLNWYFSQISENKRGFILWNRFCKQEIGKIIQKSMQPHRTDRYSDSRTMLEVIRRKQRKLQVIRKLLGMLAALILLISILIFAGMSLIKERKQDYQGDYNSCMALLQQSELLGFSAAEEYYRKASGLFPEQIQWWLHLIDRIDADTVFDLQEEYLLKELLFQFIPGKDKSAEAVLSSRENYQYAVFRTGMSYWYYYAGNGGKNAAVRWFEKVLNTSDNGVNSDEWKEIARLHIRIQKFYEKQNIDENVQEQYGQYWADLKQLWSMNIFSEESADIRLQTAKELISGIVIHSAELVHEGIRKSEIENIIDEVRMFSKQEEQTEEMERLLAEAEKSVDRIFANKEIQEDNA